MLKGQPGILYIDQHEPSNIVDVVRPALPSVVSGIPLNTSYGKADYYWLNFESKESMRERKQIGEAISDIDAVDEQMQRHLHNCDELELIAEGVAMPTPDGVQTYKISKDGRFFRPDYQFKNQPQLWARWEAFKWDLWHDCNIAVIETNSWEQTAHHIVTSFKQSQKPNHHTLKRYTHEYMPKWITQEHIKEWKRNPHIDNLVRLKGLRIGEVTATKLIKRFDTFFAVMNAPYAELVGVMGGKFAEQFLKGIGRD